MHLFPSPYKIGPQAGEGLGEIPESRFSFFVLASALMHLLVLCSCIDWNRDADLLSMARNAVIEVDLVSIPGPEPAATTEGPAVVLEQQKPDGKPGPEIIETPDTEFETVRPGPSTARTPAPDLNPAGYTETSAPVMKETGTTIETTEVPFVPPSADVGKTAHPEAGPTAIAREGSPEVNQADGPAPATAVGTFAPVKSANFSDTVAHEQRYIDENFYYIKDLITRNLTYPVLARRMKWQGTVVVSFVVSGNGEATQIRVVAGSGHSVLDKNVVATIRQTHPFPTPPAPAELTMPIKYTLRH